MADLVIQNHLEQMKSDIRKLESCAAVLRKNTADAFLQLEILDSMWSGPAHDAFRAQAEQDRAVMEQYMIWLQKYIASLQDALQVYTDCESSVMEIIRGL